MTKPQIVAVQREEFKPGHVHELVIFSNGIETHWYVRTADGARSRFPKLNRGNPS